MYCDWHHFTFGTQNICSWCGSRDDGQNFTLYYYVQRSKNAASNIKPYF